MPSSSLQVRAGQLIFADGDAGECAYLVESGRILVFVVKDGVEVPLKVLGEGEVIGEMSLIDNSPRSASCRALDDGSLLVVGKDQLLDRVRGADPVVRLLMRALLERLRSQNDSARGHGFDSGKTETEAMDDKREALRRIDLENSIAGGLQKDQFLPFYQPINDLKSGRIVGCEALIRWLQPDGRLISPAVFMDVIESSSLVHQAGRMMIEKSLRDLGPLQQRFGADFFVSINVGSGQFGDPNFLDHLEKTRESFGVDAECVKLELTERVMMEGPQAMSTLENCRAKGYRLAIDDFGTGFSNLQYLASMPLSDLKIDRSFVMKILSHERSLSIVKSLIHLARSLKLSLIAEGIETADELALLRKLGVEMGQGYLFAKPMPLDQLMQLAAQKAA